MEVLFVISPLCVDNQGNMDSLLESKKTELEESIEQQVSVNMLHLVSVLLKYVYEKLSIFFGRIDTRKIKEKFRS